MSDKKIRCAIYTRKSTEEGLEQDLTAYKPSGKRAKPILRAKSTSIGNYSLQNMMTVNIQVAI